MILAELLVPGGYGRAAQAPSGALVTIVDLHGQQAGHFVAVAGADVTEGLSGIETRRHMRALYFKTGDQLLSSRGRPLFEVVADTIGVHDYTVPACDPTRYEVDFGVAGHRNCLENMADPLRRFGVDILEVPDPFTLFQSSRVIAGGRPAVIDPPSRAGHSIPLRAPMDVICVLSPCPQDIIPGDGLSPTDMLLRVAKG